MPLSSIDFGARSLTRNDLVVTFKAYFQKCTSPAHNCASPFFRAWSAGATAALLGFFLCYIVVVLMTPPSSFLSASRSSFLGLISLASGPLVLLPPMEGGEEKQREAYP